MNNEQPAQVQDEVAWLVKEHPSEFNNYTGKWRATTVKPACGIPLYTAAPQPSDDVAKDAARYRWLRDNCDRQWDVMYQDIEIIIRDTAAEDCEPLDEIIDAAIAGGGE